MVNCSCCGEPRERLTALECRADVAVCRECIGWLSRRAGLLDVTPILPVVDMASSVSFYEAAGFDVRRYQPNGGYAFVTIDGQSVLDLDETYAQSNPDGTGAACYVIVPSVAQWHQRLVAANLPVTSVEDKPWGMREFTLSDSSGNRLRIAEPT